MLEGLKPDIHGWVKKGKHFKLNVNCNKQHFSFEAVKIVAIWYYAYVFAISYLKSKKAEDLAENRWAR
jgi:hypothetical protein